MKKLNPNIKNVSYLFISLALSLLFGGILFYVCGYEPISAYVEIVKGSLGNTRNLATSLSQATPIIFTGLAFVVALKSGVVNIGAEGQLYAGAMSAAVAGYYIKGLPSIILIPLILIIACIVSGLWGALIAFLKIKFGAQEVITAIMLNYIMQNFTSYLVNFPLKAKDSVGQTELIQKSARLPMISPQLSIAIVIAVLVAVVLVFIFNYTQTGFEMKVTGKNIFASNTAGINSSKRMIQALFISGALAGLGGATLILGSNYTFIDGFSSGYGFDGVAVAALSGQSFLGVIISGIFFGALKTGAYAINTFAKIPYDFAMVIQSFVIIFVATPRIPKYLLEQFSKLKKIKVRRGVSE